MSDPIDDDGNYVQPVTVAGPKEFTGSATDTTAEKAEATAREAAINQAIANYGVNTTQFVSFDEIIIEFNPGTNLNTTGSYTATVITKAIKIAPPSESGLSEASQAQFVASNNALQSGDLLPPANAASSAVIEVPGADPREAVNLAVGVGFPATVPDAPAREAVNLAVGVGFPAPVSVPNEFTGVDEAVAQQRLIAINTSGLPVIAEDGSVVPGIAINPETGETFSTVPPSEGAEIPAANRRNAVGSTDGFLINKSLDWRFRISLSSSADYLYRLPGINSDNILYPLSSTGGVIFPYTPQINLTYSAAYASVDLPHSNYKIYNYTGSSVDAITITGMFTAQDTVEANYMLAVMHFFKAVTKMFYGTGTPIRGTPPPLCYLTGHGTYAFDNHPVAITSFSLNYPDDVDYINAGPEIGGSSGLTVNTRSSRLTAANLNPGGTGPRPRFSQNTAAVNTRVPTRLQIMINCVPIVSRADISNNFNFEDYASGKLLRASSNKSGKGMW